MSGIIKIYKLIIAPGKHIVKRVGYYLVSLKFPSHRLRFDQSSSNIIRFSKKSRLAIRLAFTCGL